MIIIMFPTQLNTLSELVRKEIALKLLEFRFQTVTFFFYTANMLQNIASISHLVLRLSYNAESQIYNVNDSLEEY